MNKKDPFLIPNLDQIKQQINHADGLAKFPVRLLYEMLEPKAGRSPRDVYDLHWVAIYMLTGDSDAKVKARDAVWLEVMEKGPKTRPGHFWDNEVFFKKDQWISAAMAAHLAIAMDWLACEGVFTEEEIQRMSDHIVNGFWEYIAPHLKGRGRAPIYVEPMNQDAAMVCSCIVIGYLFGYKWNNDARAKRMYIDARGMAGNILAQFYKTGFDNDGFTYMRIIQAPVLALMSMAIEAIEGVEFYNQEFGPSMFSVAKFFEKLHSFTFPSGYSFPHGRYGYVQEWNLYSQAYSSYKTGNPKFLERALEKSQPQYITPWIAFDLPLAVMWTPYGDHPGRPRATIPISYDTWHDSQIWSNIASKDSQIYAQLSWREGSIGTFVLEQDQNRLILISGEGPERCNGLSFRDVKVSRGVGRNFSYFDTDEFQVSSIDISGQWDSSVLSTVYKNIFVFKDSTVVSFDHFQAKEIVQPALQITAINEIKSNSIESEISKIPVEIKTISDQFTTMPGKLGKDGTPVTHHTALLDPSPHGYSAILINYDSDQKIAEFTKNSSSFSWSKGEKKYSLYMNKAFPKMQIISDEIKTDARMILQSETSIYLWDVRNIKFTHGKLYATDRIFFQKTKHSIMVKNLTYGNYLRFTDNSMDVAILCGSSYDIYTNIKTNYTLKLPFIQETMFVQVNGENVSFQRDEEFVIVNLTKPNESEPTLDQDESTSSYFTELNEILTQYDTSRLYRVHELLSDENTYVRLVAAETLGYLGTEKDGVLLAKCLLEESNRTSDIGGKGAPWYGKWGFFSTITVMADAIRKLGNAAAIPVLKEALLLQVEPHAKESIQTAIKTLESMQE